MLNKIEEKAQNSAIREQVQEGVQEVLQELGKDIPGNIKTVIDLITATVVEYGVNSSDLSSLNGKAFSLFGAGTSILTNGIFNFGISNDPWPKAIAKAIAGVGYDVFSGFVGLGFKGIINVAVSYKTGNELSALASSGYDILIGPDYEVENIKNNETDENTTIISVDYTLKDALLIPNKLKEFLKEKDISGSWKLTDRNGENLEYNSSENLYSFRTTSLDESLKSTLIDGLMQFDSLGTLAIKVEFSDTSILELKPLYTDDSELASLAKNDGRVMWALNNLKPFYIKNAEGTFWEDPANYSESYIEDRALLLWINNWKRKNQQEHHSEIIDALYDPEAEINKYLRTTKTYIIDRKNKVEYGINYLGKLPDHKVIEFGTDTDDRNFSYTANDDRLYGAKGDDFIKAGEGNDFVEGGENNDTLYGEKGVDQLHGGKGDDTIFGGENSDYLYAGKGNDKLYGEEGDDFLYAKEGLNSLYGGKDDDYLEGGINKDYLYGEEGNDILYGKEGNDYLEGNSGDDILAGSEGNDILKAGLGKDQLYGGTGNDTLYAQEGVNSLFGEEGNDTIFGGNGSNTIEGGKGDDLLISGSKVDHFKFGLSDGNDIIEGFNDTDEKLGIDILSFERDPDKEDYIQQGNDLIIKYSTNNSVTLKDYYVKNNKIQAYKKEPKPTYEKYKVEKDIYTIVTDKKNDEIKVYDGDYKIYSNDGDDKIQAEDGNITIYSGKGDDDIYINGRGNRIIYAGEGNDKIDIPYYGKNIIYAGKGNDYIKTADANDTLSGGEGNDYIRAGYGNDTIYGNQGNDTLYGENGDDIIYSGEGKNTLNGGSGKDTFIVDVKGTYNEIQNYSNEDTLKFYVKDENSLEFFMKANKEFIIKYDDSKEIVLTNYNPLLKNIFCNDKELIIDYVNLLDSSSSYSSTSYFTQQNYYDFNYIVEDITNIKSSKIYTGGNSDYIDSGKGDDTIYSYDSNDTIIGNKGNDKLVGGKGDDNYIFYLNDGKDFILDDEGYNTANFITDGSDLKLFHINLNKNLSYDKEGSIIVQQDKNSYVFVSNYFKDDETGFGNILANNRVLDFNNLYFNLTRQYGSYKFYSELNYNYSSDLDSLINEDSKITTAAGNDNIITGDGDDTIYTNAGDDTIHAGIGDNKIYAGSGSNKIYADNGNNRIYAENGNNYIEVGNNTSLIELGNGNNTIKAKNTNETSKIQLGSGNNNITVKDGEYNIKITGNTASTNNLKLGKNWDKVEVQNGSTTIYAEDTNSGTIKLADGNDKITIGNFIGKASNSATIEVKDGNNFINLGNNWKNILAGTGNDFLFIKDFNLENYQSYINLGAGNNELYIGNGAYNITTLDGDDLIFGENGIKSINSGDGNDRISVKNNWNYIYAGEGDNNIFTGDNSKDTFFSSINVANGDNQLKVGSYWNYITLGDGNNVIETKQSLGGMIMTGDGDNSIKVSNENTIKEESLGVQVYTGSGDNTIQLGNGNDKINTGSGNDTFIFNKNDGVDNIYDSGGIDKIQFLENVEKTDIFFSQEGENLLINYGDNDSISIQSQFNLSNQIERIELSQGAYLTNEDIDNLIQNMIAFSQENEIDLTNKNEIKNNSDLMNIVHNSWNSIPA